MKRQIFILVIAFLAISINSVFGQKALHDSDPVATPSCTDDALHPIAGKKYNYSVLVNPAAGNYTWWATKDPNFIASQGTNNMATKKLTVGAAADITSTSVAYGVSSASPNVDITWSSTILSNTGYQGVAPAKTPTFVVVQFDGTGATCANNLKVYELDPKNGFTVDIMNLNNITHIKAGYGTTEAQCIDKVSKATYVAGSMQYEYGTNIFYYEVVAANFSESWKPKFTLTGQHAVQTPIIEWTYDKTLASGWTLYTPGTTTVETNELETSTGVSIYVKVTVTNNNYEGKAPRNIILAVDGQNKDGVWDINNSTCIDPIAADADDKAIQTLRMRPNITKGVFTPDPTVAPTTLIPGNEQ